MPMLYFVASLLVKHSKNRNELKGYIMESWTMRLAGNPNTIAGDFQEFTDTGLIRTILELESVSDQAAKLARAAKETLVNRRREAIAAAYAEKGDHFGVVHLQDGEFALEINTPRRVEWDQEQLGAIEAKIRDEWKADPAEYLERKLSVKESKYKAWPSELKTLFEPARLVKPGSLSLSITPIVKE